MQANESQGGVELSQPIRPLSGSEFLETEHKGYQPNQPDIVLYCIEGVVIAARCTATFSRSIVLPRI